MSGYIGYRKVPTLLNGSGVWTINDQEKFKKDNVWPALNDIYFPNVSILLHADGINNSTTFIDSSSNALSPTVGGGAKILTSQSKFGGSAIYFDGNGDYLSYDTNAVFGFGTGDYTVEMFIYLNALPGGGTKYTIIDFRLSVSGTAHTIYIDSSGYLGFWNGSSDVTTNQSPISAGQWYHIAYSKVSGVLKIFVNGGQCYSANHASDYQSSRKFCLGSAAGGSGEFLNAYVDELRVTKGVGRYTAEFTPPITPFPSF